MAAVELRVPARAEFLALVRTVVTDLAEHQTRLRGDRLDDLRLAVSEACANAVEAYSRRGLVDATVLVRCEADREAVVVEVRDEAGGFDPGGLVPHPPVTDPARLRHEHGLGIPLMRSLADQAEIESDADGTTIRLTFRPPSTAPGA